MSKTPQYDKKIKETLDALKPGERTCELTGEKWIMDEEEISWYKKFNVPPADLSPTERRRQLWGFNAGLYIWWNKHALTGAKMLSYIHPDNPIKAIPDKEWHAEDWGSKHSAEINNEKTIFEQVRELLHRIPLPAIRLFGEVTNTIGASIISAEDSFMVFGGVSKCKRCRYGYLVESNEDVLDSYRARSCQDCFAVNQCEKMYNCSYVLNCSDCLNSSFLFDCRNCESCFCSSNLRNAKYVFYNQKFSEEEYKKKMAEIDLSCHGIFEEYHQKFHQLLEQEAVWPENFNLACQDSTGEYLRNCLRCEDCFSIGEATNCYKSQMSQKGSEYCAYCSGFSGTSESYFAAGVTNSARIKFSTSVADSMNLEYCHSCYNCQDCFACVGLKNKRFNILNREYSEDEYWSLVDRIKLSMLEQGSYGRFFPGDFSPSGFIFASDLFFDMTEQELKYFQAPVFDSARGAVISQTDQDGQQSLEISDIPDCLVDVQPEKIIGKPIIDRQINRQFSIQSADLAFYRKHQLPLPKKHFFSRVRELTRLSNTFTTKQESCSNCNASIQVAENPTFKNRKIYCKKCYLEYLEKYG
ncbi:MAG: hypothetical protein ABIH67_01465 [Candidatus Uhrbacteria bacterium]